jgi:hypothetical protein
MVQVFQYPYKYIHIWKNLYKVASRGKRKKERKNDGADNPKPRTRWLAQARRGSGGEHEKLGRERGEVWE